MAPDSTRNGETGRPSRLRPRLLRRSLWRPVALALTAGLMLAPQASAGRGGDRSHDEVPKGQDHADYLAWLARSPEARGELLAFKIFLEHEHVGQVLPMWQLTRTASMWRACNGPRFEVAPLDEWQHIATTLRFIRAHVQPVVGQVEAVSGYRDEGLNRCAGGARGSAHRHYYALDLVPERPLSRTGLVRSMCAIHRWRGKGYDIGLGFYNGVRFHVDSKGFRRWGPNGKRDTSPCVTEA